MQEKGQRKPMFIVGTGTEVGKTYISGLILKKLLEMGLSAGYYKAAMSGNRRDGGGRLIPGDAQRIKEMSGTEQPLESMYSYVYENEVSPHLAAKLEGGSVEKEVVQEAFSRVRSCYDYLIVEGSGGVLCPIRYDAGCAKDEQIWLPDLIRMFAADCLLVADAGLGTINAIGLTAFYLQEHALPLKGIILNRYQKHNVMHEDNRKMCEDLTGVKVVACVGEGDQDIEESEMLMAAINDI